MLTRITLVSLLLAGLSPVRAETPAQAPLPAAPRARVHTLGEGETLWTVAVQYGLSVKSIKDANNFDDPDHLPVGTQVTLPAKAAYTLGSATSEFRPVSFVENNVPAPQLLPAPPTIQTAPDMADKDSDQASGDSDEVDASGVEVELPKRRRECRVTALEASSTGFKWPVDGFVISPFGKQRRRHRHAGIDLKAPKGTKVFAARDGWVVFSGTVRGHGRVVVLEHEDGFHTVYAHNQKNVVSPEKDGERLIKAGELIALVGASGNATTPHVHFEIRQDEKPVDPMKFLPAQ